MSNRIETIIIMVLFLSEATLASLKYSGYVDWSWWQVTSLLWAPICLAFGVLVVGLTGLALVEYINRKFLQ